MHICAQIIVDLRKLDNPRARSYRAGPRCLSGEDASVTLASNHEGHATSQCDDASASGDRSGRTGVRQGRGSPTLGAGRSRGVRVADAATSGNGGRAIAGRDLAAGGDASVADGAGGRACATLIGDGGGSRRIVGGGRGLSGATGVVVGRVGGGGVSGRIRGLLGGGSLGGESDTCRSGDQTERRGGGEQRRGRLLHCFSWNECGEG